jgi:hypothetical protein
VLTKINEPDSGSSPAQRRTPELGCEPTLDGLESCPGVVGDECTESKRISQAMEVPCAVQRVQPALDQAGRVADVVEPSRCDEEFAVVRVHRCGEFGGTYADASDVLPASLELGCVEESRCQYGGVEGIRHMGSVDATVARVRGYPMYGSGRA